MTDKKIKKYCDGLDCAICNEKEPCIYKIANELEEKLQAKEQECDQLKAENIEIRKKFGIETLINETTGEKTHRSLEVLKLREALQEIKEELSEECFDNCKCDFCPHNNLDLVTCKIVKILQKCEVENE